MKNLLERLKPEHRDSLEVSLIDYPYTLNSIYSALEENNSILDLKFDIVYSLNFQCLKTSAIYFTKVSDLFND